MDKTSPPILFANLQNLTTIRQGNIELLRIIAMLLVLIVHANYFSIGQPTQEEVIHSPIPSFTRMFVQSLSVICVNVFILITGWFGLKPKLKSISSFIFQCLFFLVGIYAMMSIIGLAEFSLNGIASCFLLTPWNWFIKAYLGLCIFAPMLNVYIERSSEQTLRKVIMFFFIFQCIYGWISSGATYIESGYSAFSFVGLYLLARYVRIYPNVLTTQSKWIDLFIFFLIITIQSAATFTLTYIEGVGGSGIIYSYISPGVILSALYLLLFFSKLRIQNRIINFLGASSFAAFLLHTNPNICLPYYKPLCIEIYEKYSGIYCLSTMLFFVLAVYAIAVMIDQVRIFCYDRIWPFIKKNDKYNR